MFLERSRVNKDGWKAVRQIFIIGLLLFGSVVLAYWIAPFFVETMGMFWGIVSSLFLTQSPIVFFFFKTVFQNADPKPETPRNLLISDEAMEFKDLVLNKIEKNTLDFAVELAKRTGKQKVDKEIITKAFLDIFYQEFLHGKSLK